MVSEPKSTGVTFPWEQAAINNENMPDNLNAPEQVLFLGLRYLYRAKKEGHIDRDTAVREKKMMLAAYEVHKFWDQLFDHVTNQIKCTDLARAEFKKNPTVENGWKLINAIERGKYL
jgi:hypothetical protein